MKLDLGALPFAHLLGFGPAVAQPKARAADDGGDAPNGPPRPAPGAHLAGAQEDKPKEGDKDKKPEEGDEKEKKPEDGDGEKPKEGGDTSQADKPAQDAADPAARIQAIVTHACAAGPYAALANFLAFRTALPAADATVALQLAVAAGQAAAPRQTLDARMQHAPNPDPGPDGGQQQAPDAKAASDFILASARAARGEK